MKKTRRSEENEEDGEKIVREEGEKMGRGWWRRPEDGERMREMVKRKEERRVRRLEKGD
jgi:hypothetical protein